MIKTRLIRQWLVARMDATGKRLRGGHVFPLRQEAALGSHSFVDPEDECLEAAHRFYAARRLQAETAPGRKHIATRALYNNLLLEACKDLREELKMEYQQRSMLAEIDTVLGVYSTCLTVVDKRMYSIEHVQQEVASIHASFGADRKRNVLILDETVTHVNICLRYESRDQILSLLSGVVGKYSCLFMRPPTGQFRTASTSVAQQKKTNEVRVGAIMMWTDEIRRENCLVASRLSEIQAQCNIHESLHVASNALLERIDEHYMPLLARGLIRYKRKNEVSLEISKRQNELYVNEQERNRLISAIQEIKEKIREHDNVIGM